VAIAPRCALSGSGSASAITPALTGWTNIGGPSGTAPVAGDIVFITGSLNAASLTVSQSGGTGTWTLHTTGESQTGLTSFAAFRVFDGTETSPSFIYGTSKRFSWAMIALAPDAANTISIDVWATTNIDTVAATTHTANAATAAGSGECSLILGDDISSANGTSAMVFTAPTNWTLPASASATNTGTASTKGYGSSIAYRTGQSGTVTPVAETMTGGTVGGNTQANMYHVLVMETAALPPSRPLVISQAIKRAAYY
jgi:hypothetical protein